MKVAAFRAVLAAAEGLYRDGGNETAAQALGLLARLLAARDAMTAAAFAALLAKAPTPHDSGAAAGAPTVAQLRGALDRLQSLCQAAGAKTAEKDLKALVDVLEAHAAQPVAAFATHVQAWLSEAASKPKARSKATATKSAMSNEEAIASYLAALRNAGTDRSAFEVVLATLKADKSVKSAALGELARRFANTVTNYKSIAAAHADIASAFTQRARFASKVG
jgi:enamine deaminase RidA (YjgF/YER057c/UK114 family)